MQNQSEIASSSGFLDQLYEQYAGLTFVETEQTLQTDIQPDSSPAGHIC